MNYNILPGSEEYPNECSCGEDRQWHLSPQSRLTWIYLIKDKSTGYIKIGRSDHPDQRLAALIKQNTVMPTANDFYLFKCWRHHSAMEQILHHEYAIKHVRGEWFDLDNDDLSNIEPHFFDSVQWDTGKTPYEEYEESYARHLASQQEWPEVVQ